MNMCALGDATGSQGNAEGPLKGGAADRFFGRGSTDAAPPLGREEQSSMAMGFPLLAQKLQSALRHWDIPVLVSFAATDV